MKKGTQNLRLKFRTCVPLPVVGVFKMDVKSDNVCFQSDSCCQGYSQWAGLDRCSIAKNVNVTRVFTKQR